MKSEYTLTVCEAAKLIGKDPQFVRIGLQKKQLPYGHAVEKTNGGYDYVIYKHALAQFIGRWWES